MRCPKSFKVFFIQQYPKLLSIFFVLKSIKLSNILLIMPFPKFTSAFFLKLRSEHPNIPSLGYFLNSVLCSSLYGFLIKMHLIPSTHSVRLLWTSDQPDAETDSTQHSHKTGIHDPPGFEPASQ